MSIKDQHIKEIVKVLQSGREQAVIEVIRNMYNTGTVEMLPYVFGLFFTTHSESIRLEILNLLNNIKDNHASSYFTDAIMKYRGQEFFHQIVSSCWQNGLDFSKDIKTFIDLVIEQDFYTAIEAFSVVEENISAVSPAEREIHSAYIHSKIGKKDDDRNRLLRELSHIVSNISGPFKLIMN